MKHYFGSLAITVVEKGRRHGPRYVTSGDVTSRDIKKAEAKFPNKTTAAPHRGVEDQFKVCRKNFDSFIFM